MGEVAGAESDVTWVGTLAGVLGPGVAVGALLGWAEHLRQTGGRRGWRWLALTPLLFIVAPLAMPGALAALVTTGIGGGAIMVPLIGLAGGYALSGRGRVWTRAACGLLALSIIPLWAVMAPLAGGSALAVGTPRGALVALHFYALLAVLSLACSAPFRPVVDVGRSLEPKAADERL
ncbi:hypothetical protein [Arthrobacter burdickii]|uniref:Uncharacterized protein n=1 Tax=Arthrobacter burdickii TaxID=3035920 RepID=A0ABT8K4R3_9MICC|nr:hypothetical protein [Arthrobacter burdickii]MDN4611537.1 hypothetical protein [Arthrobacter burdickii]